MTVYTDLPGVQFYAGNCIAPCTGKGVSIGDYYCACADDAANITNDIEGELRRTNRLLVLGTEECMLPALILGATMEKKFSDAAVFCHATTRSPIGVSSTTDYPIRNGYCLPSFYDETRQTYLYNLASYDTVVLRTDSQVASHDAARALSKILAVYGVKKMFVVGGQN